MSPTTPDPDNTHVLRVQQLFMAQHQSVLAYLLSLTPNMQDAQDLLQEVFIVVSRKAHTWSEGTNFLAWACTIARYEALHHSRALQRQMVSLDADVLELLSSSEEPKSEIIELRIERLKECMKRLSPRSRELVMLRYHAAQMPELIAESLNWSVGAVRVALTRAKKNLRSCINEQFSAEDHR